MTTNTMPWDNLPGEGPPFDYELEAGYDAAGGALYDKAEDGSY